jgi:hypothetical protein
LKGTKISTPSGDRLVQDLQIGDEVQTLAGRKTIKWIGYNKFTKEEGRAWHDNVMPIRVARFAIEYYHIDLGTHEVIYAEGVSVESFFDDGSNRESFSNFIQYERLYGVERQSKMTPFAPILRYRGRHQELKGLVRSLISNVVDVRDPIQVAYDQLAKRAEAMLV